MRRHYFIKSLLKSVFDIPLVTRQLSVKDGRGTVEIHTVYLAFICVSTNNFKTVRVLFTDAILKLTSDRRAPEILASSRGLCQFYCFSPNRKFPIAYICPSRTLENKRLQGLLKTLRFSARLGVKRCQMLM